MHRNIVTGYLGFGLLALGCGSSSSANSQDAGGIGGSSGMITTAGSSNTSRGSGGSSVGGTSTVSGASSTRATTGGTTSLGGSPSTGGQSGKPLARTGDNTSTTHDYLNLGSMRLLNNNWGSVELQRQGKTCSAPMSVNVNADGSFGWTFDRGNCGDDGSHPDYPELEFGVAPFGYGSSLLTSPPFSSTTLLPQQVKDITDASVSIGNFSINLQNNLHWNLDIEFWLSRSNPLTTSNAEAYVEIMGLWGWNANSWACTTGLSSTTVSSGGKSYTLCHQSDSWGSAPKWRFFQFEANGGSQQSFSGTVDVKAFLDWFFSSSYGSGVSKDLWLTRIEIGSEIADTTSGTCTIKDIKFTINGVTQRPTLAN